MTIAACATGPRAPEGDLAESEQHCLASLERFNRAVHEAGSPNARLHRVEGYPHLRTSRFLDSFRENGALEDDQEQRETWLRAMLALGREAREIEWSTLPEAERERLGSGLPRELDACGGELARADLASQARMDDLITHAAAADDYSTTARTLGLYPVTRWGMLFGVHRWQAGARERFEAAPPEDASSWTWYLPEDPFRDSTLEARRILTEAPRDALGRPELTDRERSVLLRAYAPIWAVETEGPYDRMGRPVWPNRDAERAVVQPEETPPVYVHHDHTRVGDGVGLQLIYGVWFPERPKTGSLDLLGGHMSGVLYRVTLDESGQVVMYDTIHHCGCYHQFHAGPGWQPRASPDFAEPPLVLPTPVLAPGERAVIGLRTRTHYAEHFFGAGQLPEDALAGQIVATEDYRELERLTVPGDAGSAKEPAPRRSLFNERGLVEGTERGERWVLWPAGVPEPGAKRQYGRHLTAFVGRRFFDGPDLVERVFERRPDPGD